MAKSMEKFSLLAARALSPRALIGLSLSISILVWLFVSIEWTTFLRELKLLPWWHLLPLALVIFLSSLVRAFRWQILLIGSAHLRVRTLFDAVMIGAMANFLLPFRLGDLAMPLVLKKSSNCSLAAVLSATLLERMIDLVVVLSFFAFLTFVAPDLPDWIYIGAGCFGLVAVGLFSVVLTCCFASGLVLRVVTVLVKNLPTHIASWGLQFTEQLVTCATRLKSIKRVLLICILSVMIWATVFLYYYLFLYSFSYEGSIALAMTISVFVALAIAAPSAPGFVGVYQAACVAAFALFGVPQEKALAYSIVTHLHQIVVSVLYGWYALTRLNLHLSDLQTQNTE